MDRMDRIHFPAREGGFVYFVYFVRGLSGVDGVWGWVGEGAWPVTG